MEQNARQTRASPFHREGGVGTSGRGALREAGLGLRVEGSCQQGPAQGSPQRDADGPRAARQGHVGCRSLQQPGFHVS